MAGNADMEINNISLALVLTILTGLSTGIGSLIALLAKRTNTAFLSFALGFSAGVMIYVSMVAVILAPPLRKNTA